MDERSKLAFDVGLSGDQRRVRLFEFLSEDAVAVEDICGDEGASVASALRDLASSFSTPVSKEVSALFVGDCLHLDVIGFLTETLAKRDVALAPHFVTDKNPVQAAKTICSLGEKPFVVVFHSPFTYEASNAFLVLLNWRGMTMARSKRVALFEEATRDAKIVVTTLAETFACPIYVHNSAAIVRHGHSLKSGLKQRLSSGSRAGLRTEIDNAVDHMIAELNEATLPHLLKFDELRYLDAASETKLSEHLYKASLQHPARIGAFMARDYEMILETASHLLKKKMVVCDLDNILWGGIIGEGVVDHFADRQSVLKDLKSKGVVLSIASKNDPTNVHWRGGVLNEDDFVY